MFRGDLSDILAKTATLLSVPVDFIQLGTTRDQCFCFLN